MNIIFNTWLIFISFATFWLAHKVQAEAKTKADAAVMVAKNFGRFFIIMLCFRSLFCVVRRACKCAVCGWICYSK